MNCAPKELPLCVISARKKTDEFFDDAHCPLKVNVLPAPSERVLFDGRHEVCATPLLRYVPDFFRQWLPEAEKSLHARRTLLRDGTL